MYTITDCPKVGGLEQQELIFSQFCRSEDQNQGVSRAVLALGGSIGESISGLFQLLVAAGLPWFVATFLSALSSHCLLLCVHVTQLPLMLSYEDTNDCTQIIQDTLLLLRS